jgi:competence protein ComEC
MRELYGALFLALPISKILRERVTLLGVNHLLALSGFHMGLLWAVLYGGLSLLYRPLQERFFPWRLRLLDVGIVVLLLLGGYLWLTGMPPSLIRAYVMLVVGWAALIFGLELLSFAFLGVCVVVLVALFPELAFSMGFWLSVAGVFYIYLFLLYTKKWPAWAVFSGLNLWVFVAMQPVVHLFFPTFSLWQLLSPLLTLVFTVFYPLAMALHLAGLGGWPDRWLSALLQLPSADSAVAVNTPLWLFGLYLLVSVGAVRFRPLRYAPLVVAGLFFCYLVEVAA